METPTVMEPEGAGGAASPVDLEFLASILGLDDPAYLNDLVKLFWDSVADTPERLKALIAARDAAGLRDEAHATKGAAASAGAVPLSEVMKIFQVAAQAADWDLIDATWPRAEAAFQDLGRYVKALPSG